MVLKTRMMKINSLMGILVSCMLFVQCDSPHFYQNQVSTQNNWDKNAAASFEFEVKDTVGRYNFYLVTRNNNEYPYSNIYLFTRMTDPKGEVFIDTLQYFLAFQDGEWVGTGSSLKEAYLVYREKVALKDTGKYKLQVWHGMRDDKLIGIEDISLIVDKK